jgi:hypothetical protein
MNKSINRLVVLMIIATAPIALVGCESNSDEPAAPKQAAPVSVVQTTIVTDENYGLAESEIIFADYVGKIAAVTGTNGMGEWLHLRKGADAKDRAIMRINFDTIYSTVILDLTEPATLTMPETDGRYQSAWIITDEHYNPMAFVKPGSYELTQENVGRRYAMIGMRTQVNVMDPKEHNAGTAMGWGGLTAERAVYPSIYPESVEPQRLTLKDVPAGAFWSITVYDAEGYPQADVYNINSAFAVPNEDGIYTIHFGGDKDAVNYMDIFEDWNLALRIYEPTEAYFTGEWVMPELELVK